jgi:CRISPR/Cas system-associated protein Cas7 (RAMP superfamily)
MFILSKTLNRDSLQKAVQEKVKLIKEWKKDYDNMLSKLWIIYNDNYFEMEKQIKEKWNFKEYKEWLDTITKKCGCNDLELTEQKETIEKIEAYLK